MPIYDVKVQASGALQPRKERVEARNGIEAQAKVRDQMRYENTHGIILDAVLVIEEEDTDKDFIVHLESQIKALLKVDEGKISAPGGMMTMNSQHIKGHMQGLIDVLELIKTLRK